MRVSDRILALIRRIFHNNPEFRHDSFKHVARFAPVIPFMGGRPDLSKTLNRVVTFADGSNPLHFGAPIVLAAGANKTALRICDFANMGFGGFIEKDRAIHNSMGLNNDGVEAVTRRTDAQIAAAHRAGMCVGISVAETPGLTDENEKVKDIIESFSIAYRVADYIEINVSCPNTGENRLDLDMSFIDKIFSEIKKYRDAQSYRKAVYAKLSPDMAEAHTATIMDALVKAGVNGVVIGNTYPTKKLTDLPVHVKYDDLTPLRADGDRGGMSGRPLYENMVKNVKFIREHYPQMSVMACGGIDHGYKIYDLIKLGVDAVQCYSVVAFRWMAAHAMRKELEEALSKDGFRTLADYDAKNPKG